MQQPPNGYGYPQPPGPHTQYPGPYTQYPQQFPPASPPRQPSRRDKAIVICLVMGVVAFAWCIIYNANQNPDQTSIAQATPTPVNITDTIVLDGISCVPENISASADGDTGYSISFFASFTNHSQSEWHYYPSDFQVKTDAGIIMNPQGGVPASGGALAPGGQSVMFITFSFVGNLHKSELLWQPIGHTDELDHAWSLSKISLSTS